MRTGCPPTLGTPFAPPRFMDEHLNGPGASGRGMRGIRLPGELSIGRVFGIAIRVDLSWVLVLAFVALGLTRIFVRDAPEWGALVSIVTAASISVLFLASVLAHELAHAAVARACGLRVRSVQLFPFGGMAQLETEPVQPLDEALVALAGTALNAAAGLVTAAIGSFAAEGRVAITLSPSHYPTGAGPGSTVLLWLGTINVALAVFNALPGYPLDGGRLLRAVLARALGDRDRATRIASGLGVGVGWTLVSVGIAMLVGMKAPIVGAGALPGAWLAAIGWLVRSVAARTALELRVSGPVRGATVADVMRDPGPTVPADATMDNWLNGWVLTTERSVFAVTHEGHFLGLLTEDMLAASPRERWPSTHVVDVMVPLARLSTVSPTDDLQVALAKFSGAETGCLPVMWGARLLGIVQPADVGQFVLARLAGRAPNLHELTSNVTPGATPAES